MFCKVKPCESIVGVVCLLITTGVGVFLTEVSTIESVGVDLLQPKNNNVPDKIEIKIMLRCWTGELIKFYSKPFLNHSVFGQIKILVHLSDHFFFVTHDRHATMAGENLGLIRKINQLH